MNNPTTDDLGPSPEGIRAFRGILVTLALAAPFWLLLAFWLIFGTGG